MLDLIYEERLEILLKVGHGKFSAQAILALQDKLAEMTTLYERHQKWRSMDLKNIRKHEETIRGLTAAANEYSRQVHNLTKSNNALEARVRELEWQYSQASAPVPLSIVDFDET